MRTGFPPDSPILGFYAVVDYAYVEIGGKEFLLPKRSTLRIVTKKEIARNVTEFANYRKFTSKVKIQFEKQ